MPSCALINAPRFTLSALMLLVACDTTPAHDAARTPDAAVRPEALRIAVVADLEGVLEPCGCTRDPRGGVDRLAQLLTTLRARPGPLLTIAAGNLLHAPTSAGATEDATLVEQNAQKAQAIAAILSRLELDVVAPGPGDLHHAPMVVRGLVQRRAASVLGSAGGREELDGMQRSTTKQLGALTVTIHWQQTSAGETELRVQALGADAGSAREVHIVTGLGAAQAQIAAREGELEVRPASRSRELLVLDLSTPVPSVQRIAVDERVPQLPWARRLLTQLFQRIKEQTRVRTGAHPDHDERTDALQYVGSRACAACHTAAYQWWLGTAHARAFTTLEQRGRELDLECIGCHVTGFDQPGGSTLVRLDELRGVGCESCHGPGGAHVDDPQPPHRGLVRVTSASTCLQCHDASHSDSFHYESKRGQLLVAGHGQ